MKITGKEAATLGIIPEQLDDFLAGPDGAGQYDVSDEVVRERALAIAAERTELRRENREQHALLWKVYHFADPQAPENRDADPPWDELRAKLGAGRM
jgi:hypothetical protein